MRVLIDGDAFPDINDIVLLCKKYHREVIIYVDTSHEIKSDYAKVVIVSEGSNAVDLVLENNIKNSDLVLTRDYGVAVIALSKKALCINQLGNFYTNDNIDYLLEIKNINRKLRKTGKVKGPKKRSKMDKLRLLSNIEEVIKWKRKVRKIRKKILILE